MLGSGACGGGGGGARILLLLLVAGSLTSTSAAVADYDNAEVYEVASLPQELARLSDHNEDQTRAKLRVEQQYVQVDGQEEQESIEKPKNKYQDQIQDQDQQQTQAPESVRRRQSRAEASQTQQQHREVAGARPRLAKCALVLQRNYPPLAGAAASTAREERICISLADVEEAIGEARKRREFPASGLPRGMSREQLESIEPSAELIAELGELNLAASEALARKFALTAEEIANGLPLIDMSQTSLSQLCPLLVRPIECDPSARFRSFTGHCNNLANPTWGAAQTPFARNLPAQHPDGLQALRASVTSSSNNGQVPLPNARLVTSSVHRDEDQPSVELSLMIMVFGQVIDHDVALAAPPRDENGIDFSCCKREHPNCMPIEIRADDPLYGKLGVRCMDFKRSLAGLRPNCALGPRVHNNKITATVDANTVYGSSKTVADSLREFDGGRLRVQNTFQGSRKPLLPAQVDKPNLDCIARRQGEFCFTGGDERASEQPTLTVMHTILMRDHNRRAAQLARVNPHWSDDRLYHETRHILAAVVQNILISEYLPLLLGQQTVAEHNLTAQHDGGHWQGYNPEVEPIISHAFSTAAFRQGHTFIQGKVRLHDPQSHDYIGFELLRTLFKRPFHYYKPGRLDQVLAGMVNTPAQSYDPFITREISGHLFQEPNEIVGVDLPAINLSRGREQGTASYNLFREWCGLKRAQSFADLRPLLSNRTATHYARLYAHVDDIDLWSAGVSERRMRGAQIGPTFACIIARQFQALKAGDRFWFENGPGLPSSFTREQLAELRKVSLARVLCVNSDAMNTVQTRALELPHPVLNPRATCNSLKDANLEFWREEHK